MKRLYFTLTLAVVSLITFGCQPLAGRASSGPMDRQGAVLESYRLIDLGRQDEAVAMLESRLNENPNDLELRMAAASAFASKAGVKAADFVPVIVKAVDFSKSHRLRKESLAAAAAASAAAAVIAATAGDQNPQASQSKSNNESKTAAAKAAFDSVVYYTQMMKLMAEVFKGLPSVSRENEGLMLEALRHTTAIEPQLRLADYRYRVVLRVILLKTYLLTFGHDLEKIVEVETESTTEAKAESKPVSTQLTPTCTAAIAAAKRDIVATSQQLNLLLLDISASTKEDAETLKNAAQESAKITAVITSLGEDVETLAFLLELVDVYPFVAALRDNLSICR
jgi:hypothetical protein